MSKVGFNRDMDDREAQARGGMDDVESRLERVQGSDDEARLQALEDLYDELEKGLEDSTSGV